MCQTAFISQSIIKLGTRSYRHSLEALAPNEYGINRLRRLNRDLDAFYELLYSQCNTITESDYMVFGEQLTSMIDTINFLYKSCKHMPNNSVLDKETERLKMNYSALKELNDDIRNFKINASGNAEWTTLLSDASKALKNLSHD